MTCVLYCFKRKSKRPFGGLSVSQQLLAQVYLAASSPEGHEGRQLCRLSICLFWLSFTNTVFVTIRSKSKYQLMVREVTCLHEGRNIHRPKSEELISRPFVGEIQFRLVLLKRMGTESAIGCLFFIH